MSAAQTRTRKPAPKVLPFNVPAPFDTYLRTAVERMEDLRDETKTAARRVEKKVKVAAENVREQAEVLAKDPKHFVDTMVRDGKNLRVSIGKEVAKVKNEMSREATRIADEVSRRVSAKLEDVVETSLHKLNLATRDEIAALNRKVDALGKKKVVRKPAVRRARRA